MIKIKYGLRKHILSPYFIHIHCRKDGTDHPHRAYLIIVCMAIYAVPVQSIATESDIIMPIWSCVGYTALLCFTLFKTGSLAKSVFSAH